jgi:hypothetical protein
MKRMRFLRQPPAARPAAHGNEMLMTVRQDFMPNHRPMT